MTLPTILCSYHSAYLFHYCLTPRYLPSGVGAKASAKPAGKDQAKGKPSAGTPVSQQAEKRGLAVSSKGEATPTVIDLAQR